jgi:hypothetical protein
MTSETTVGRNTVWGTPPELEIEVEVTAFPPIFLVGEQADRRRLAKLLHGRDGISCAPDSDLLVDLAGAARRNFPALFHYGYPEQYWFRRVAGFFDALQTEYATSRHLTRWAATVDPGALALVDRLFPTCRVVRVLPGSAERQSRRPDADDARRLSARYYRMFAADLSQPDAALTAVLAFLDPLVEATSRP